MTSKEKSQRNRQSFFVCLETKYIFLRKFTEDGNDQNKVTFDYLETARLSNMAKPIDALEEIGITGLNGAFRHHRFNFYVISV